MYHNNNIVLKLKTIANPNGLQNYWAQKYYQETGYLLDPGEDSDKTGNRWPVNSTLFLFPFSVSGEYIDQAASNLVFFGHPFFYHHLPSDICHFPEEIRRHQEVIMTGSNLLHIDKEPSTEWLKCEHIHFMIQWMLRDLNNPLLNEFHVIPNDISTSFQKNLLGEMEVDTIAQALHKYCKNN
jgi:hypothetical protein